jgi:dihydropyrimidinase
MSIDAIVSGGTVVKPDGMVETSIGIDDGVIVALGEPDDLPNATRVIDASGKLVFPGIIDPHVHVDPQRRPGDFRTETAAAALGGITTVLDFAWQGGSRQSTDEAVSLLDGVEYKRDVASDSVVDYGFHGAIWREDRGVFDELEDVIDRGVTSFKMFTTKTPLGFIDPVLEALARLDAVALFHAEEPTICDRRIDDLKRRGESDPARMADARPSYAEAIATDNVLRLASRHDAKVYCVHVSSKDAVDTFASYRGDGSRMRAETCTHYVKYDKAIYEEFGTLAAIKPPFRSERDVEALFERLKRDELSIVSSDHVSYGTQQKADSVWWDTVYGIPGLQWSFPVFYDEAVNNRGFSPTFVARAMSRNPARTFGIPGKGDVEIGYDADLVVFDPDERYEISSAANRSGSDLTIYEGLEVEGRVAETIVRGEQVASDGEITVDPGHGNYVHRDIPAWDS